MTEAQNIATTVTTDAEALAKKVETKFTYAPLKRAMIEAGHVLSEGEGFLLEEFSKVRDFLHHKGLLHIIGDQWHMFSHAIAQGPHSVVTAVKADVASVETKVEDTVKTEVASVENKVETTAEADVPKVEAIIKTAADGVETEIEDAVKADVPKVEAAVTAEVKAEVPKIEAEIKVEAELHSLTATAQTPAAESTVKE